MNLGISLLYTAAVVGLVASGNPAPRTAPARELPVPATVSPELQKLIGRPIPAYAAAVPQTPAEWRAMVQRVADYQVKTFPAMEARLGVKVKEVVIGGVDCFEITPDVIPAANRNRLLIHLHGGGYVLYPGLSGVGEAILMAGIGHFKIISVNYRMPPDFPYPAAMDDAMAVWRQAVTMQKPANIAVFGTSTGGGMTLALVQRAMAEHLPLPAAIAPGTPWADLSKTGDTLFTNAFVDNVLVTNDGFLDAAAHLYAHGLDLKDPRISPIYGDFKNFPPAILTSGTRDLFLSNTVRTHQKLRAAGVDAELQVFEGMSHAQYILDDRMPETKFAFEQIAQFFDKHLGRD